MTAKDHIKLMNKGFTIIRADLFRLTIKYKQGLQDWKILEKGFTTKAAVERRIKELLENPLRVED